MTPGWRQHLLVAAIAAISPLSAQARVSQNLDLFFAPPPELSPAAWQEIQAHCEPGKSIGFDLTLQAKRGRVVSAKAASPPPLPRTVAETESWVTKRWRFNPEFSGTTTQPITYRIRVPQTKAQPIQTARGDFSSARLFKRRPAPPFPTALMDRVSDYQHRSGRLAVLVVSVTARNGALVDLRVVGQQGPPECCDYAVRWIRKSWEFYPGVNGTFELPICYFMNR